MCLGGVIADAKSFGRRDRNQCGGFEAQTASPQHWEARWVCEWEDEQIQ